MQLYLIHYLGVYHGDLEPRNVVRKGWCRLKIIDFAFSDVDHMCPGWRECGELKRVWHELQLDLFPSERDPGGEVQINCRHNLRHYPPLPSVFVITLGMGTGECGRGHTDSYNCLRSSGGAFHDVAVEIHCNCHFNVTSLRSRRNRLIVNATLILTIMSLLQGHSTSPLNNSADSDLSYLNHISSCVV